MKDNIEEGRIRRSKVARRRSAKIAVALARSSNDVLQWKGVVTPYFGRMGLRRW